MKKGISAVLPVLTLAAVLMTLGMCILGLTGGPLLLGQPRGAVDCTQALAEALEAGDYEALGGLLYSRPDLGVHRDPADPVGRRFWEAYLASVDCEFSGNCYATDRGVARDLTVHRLSFAAVTEPLGEASRQVLEQRVQSADDMSEIYDENNEYREEVVMASVLQAAEEILAREGITETLNLTVQLVFEEGQWWIVPDQPLLDALSWGR